MKDMLGNEIEVGDELVYTSYRGAPWLTLGVVEAVDEVEATIRRLHSGSSEYTGVRNGIRLKCIYDYATDQGKFVPTPARNTKIGVCSRCMITKKAGTEKMTKV